MNGETLELQDEHIHRYLKPYHLVEAELQYHNMEGEKTKNELRFHQDQEPKFSSPYHKDVVYRLQSTLWSHSNEDRNDSPSNTSIHESNSATFHIHKHRIHLNGCQMAKDKCEKTV